MINSFIGTTQTSSNAPNRSGFYDDIEVTSAFFGNTWSMTELSASSLGNCKAVVVVVYSLLSNLGFLTLPFAFSLSSWYSLAPMVILWSGCYSSSSHIYSIQYI